MYVINGLHKVLPEHLEEYLANVKLHARNSASEPGCLRYDVLQDIEDPTTICLFEVFADEDAFNAHLATDHYKWWMDASRDWRDHAARRRHVMRYVTPEA